jgi:hypothetical protein
MSFTTRQRNCQTLAPPSANDCAHASVEGHLNTAKLVPNFADRGCDVDSFTNTFGRILGFLHRSRYFFFQVAPQLYSRG